MENAIETAPVTKARWVWARYSGDKAKYADGLSNAGICYFALERPERGNAWITVAFRYPCDKPLPEGVEEVLDYRMIARLDKWKRGE